MPRSPRSRLFRFCLLCGALWCLAALLLDRLGLRHEGVGSYDAIVVAGCQVGPDGLPSEPLRRRTLAAVELWRQGRAPLILFTGGVGTHPPSEALAAANLAWSLGVPTDAIRLEDASTSTEENARFAADRHGFQRILLVTDAYHVVRATRVFRRYFPQVDGWGTRGPLGARTWGAMREVCALAVYTLLGRI